MGLQTCLEKRALETRPEQLIRNDYGKEDEYSVLHKDAISDGDKRGKGTSHGGHTHFLPNCNGVKGVINYQNFDTQNGGDLADTKQRAYLESIMLFNKNNEYTKDLVDTTLNNNDGQVIINYR